MAPPNPSVKGPIALNENRTQRIGEHHSQARLSDAQVEEIRLAYEAFDVGHPQHVGYKTLAMRFGVAKRTIRDIVNYSARNHWPGAWKMPGKRSPRI